MSGTFTPAPRAGLRALLFVGVDEDRIRVRGLDLDDVGGEIHLTDSVDTSATILMLRAAISLKNASRPPAEVVVHRGTPPTSPGAVADEVGHLRHAHLLAEGCGRCSRCPSA
jgi:hypothetical protein